MKQKHTKYTQINTNKYMGPVSQNPIHRTDLSLLISGGHGTGKWSVASLSLSVCLSVHSKVSEAHYICHNAMPLQQLQQNISSKLLTVECVGAQDTWHKLCLWSEPHSDQLKQTL